MGCMVDLCRAIAQRSGYRPNSRRILAGESESADGWTDGKTYIYVHRKFLKKPLDVHTTTRVVTLLVHEFLHDASDMDAHPHDATFYKGFHDVMSYDWFGGHPLTEWVESKLDRFLADAA